MNPKGRRLLSAGVLFSALVFGGATCAQPGGAPGAEPSQAGAGDGSGNARAGLSVDSITQPHAMRASRIIGADVENADGGHIGRIRDMVVDARNERVRYVVLSRGAVSGTGDRLFAYPMSMVETRGGNSDTLVINVNQEKLDRAPGFDGNKWPDFADGGYTGRIDRYYGSSSRHDGEQAGKPVRASDLIGRGFDDTRGRKAGELRDLIVDSSTGRVEYAIVDFDDSWTKKTDGRLVAIPLSDITVSGRKNDRLVIGISPERIDMSHAFASNQWPDFSDPAWARQRGTAAQSQGSGPAPASRSSGGSPRA